MSLFFQFDILTIALKTFLENMTVYKIRELTKLCKIIQQREFIQFCLEQLKNDGYVNYAKYNKKKMTLDSFFC